MQSPIIRLAEYSHLRTEDVLWEIAGTRRRDDLDRLRHYGAAGVYDPPPAIIQPAVSTRYTGFWGRISHPVRNIRPPQ